MEQINSIIGMAQNTEPTAQGGSGYSLGSAPATPGAADAGSWYMALADAWGRALDQQAGKVVSLSQRLARGGKDTMSTTTQLSAQAQRLQFMSQSASTSTKSVAHALEALARKD